ncbi:hypothetical protein R1sor_011137 [Riccia sorocarpa]|uniref:MADF domain-containing protein n=1 Tax=Riccia sorocarpa TaxID=122646 RepID=A0ABD3I447_9MARC
MESRRALLEWGSISRQDHQSIIALKELKKAEWESFQATTSRRGVIVSSDVKWRLIRDGLLARGIDADVGQIRSKWDMLYNEFKRVRDWNKVSGNESSASPIGLALLDRKRRVDADTSSNPVEEAQGEKTGRPVDPAPLPPDAVGVSNSGKRKKTAHQANQVVNAFQDFGSQLVDVDKRHSEAQAVQYDKEHERLSLAEERESFFQKWQMEIEEKKIAAAQKSSENLCDALGGTPRRNNVITALVFSAIQAVIEYIESEEALEAQPHFKRQRTGFYEPTILPSCSLLSSAVLCEFLVG